jgi:hypothetical protein
MITPTTPATAAERAAVTHVTGSSVLSHCERARVRAWTVYIGERVTCVTERQRGYECAHRRPSSSLRARTASRRRHRCHPGRHGVHLAASPTRGEACGDTNSGPALAVSKFAALIRDDTPEGHERSGACHGARASYQARERAMSRSMASVHTMAFCFAERQAQRSATKTDRLVWFPPQTMPEFVKCVA